MSLPESFLEDEKSSKDKLFKVAFGLGLLFFISSILMYLYYFQNEDKVEVIRTVDEVINEDKDILIDISGAVEKPGIYTMKSEGRMNDLIVKAGGFSDSVNKEWVAKNLNLASKLKDGQKIYIPLSGEEVEIANLENGKININQASLEELKQLSGVGEVTAKNIIKYRNENGDFESIQDILEITGIGEKTVEGFSDEIIF